MKRILILATFILLAAGFIATQVFTPDLQTHTLIEGTPCHWLISCGYEPLSAAALAGRGGILIAMLLITVVVLHYVLRKLSVLRKGPTE